jgi:flavin-binding protein dodecin
MDTGFDGLWFDRDERLKEARGQVMSGHVYRVTEVVGSSTEGVDSAVRTAVARAAETLHGLDWFEVTEIRGRIEEGRIAEYQVGLKLGFRLDES